MRQERCTASLEVKDLKMPVCYYCRSSIRAGEEVINKDQKFYHRDCFKRLFTLTSKCLTCWKAAECLNQALACPLMVPARRKRRIP